MTFSELNEKYDQMQSLYGNPALRSILYGGCMETPDICFVFMNPTGRNVASAPEWTGIRAPWVGTKNVWDLFYAIGKLDQHAYQEIKCRRPKDWTPDFAEWVYQELARSRLYLTNLGKCTKADAAPVPQRVYLEYLPLLEQEIQLVQPKVIVLFGNQVSSVFLGQAVSVSQCRKKRFTKEIGGKEYDCFPVFYPVGNGRANIGKSIEDIRWICDYVL